jgi:hypothetical protein
LRYLEVVFVDPEEMVDAGPGFEGETGDNRSVRGLSSSGIPSCSGSVFFSILAFVRELCSRR